MASNGGATRRLIGWLSPGFGFKRHVAVLAVGAFLGAVGLSDLARDSRWPLFARLGGGTGPFATVEAAALVAVGVVLSVYAIGRITRAVVDAAIAPAVGRLFRAYPEAALASRGPRVVAIGGGTGLSVLLRGLKRYTWNLTAVVAVSDDGGSSGRLRAELGMPPPGDIRNCLVALADTEPLMERLFQHRMAAGSGLKDHAFGNLFLAAMTEITGGDFEQAIRESSRVLAVRGRVLPSTLAPVRLRAELEDGTWLEGESRIGRAQSRIRRVELVPERPAPLAEVLEAVAEADLIVLGPGSLYTSIVPHLLVAGMAEALRASGALKVYVANIMTQPGETDGMDAAAHVDALIRHGATLDVAVVNTGRLSAAALERYRREGAEPVAPATDELRGRGLRVVEADLWNGEEGVLRHDADSLARLIVALLLERRMRLTGRLDLGGRGGPRPKVRGGAGGDG
jgi:uncharacterized cofD-like protein